MDFNAKCNLSFVPCFLIDFPFQEPLQREITPLLSLVHAKHQVTPEVPLCIDTGINEEPRSYELNFRCCLIFQAYTRMGISED